MSTFNIGGNIQADNIVVGDGGQIVVTGAAAAEIKKSVDDNAAAIEKIENAFKELKAEVASGQPRQGRIRELLATLGAGAGALTAMVQGIENIRRVTGQ